MAQRKSKANCIDPIAVTAAALKACKCAADYHRLGNTTEASIFQAAWNSLPDKEQQRLTQIVNSNTQPEPQVIADELAACGTMIQLQAVKASYGEVSVKAAWKLLPQSERDRLKVICSDGATECESQSIPATAASLEKQHKDISQLTLAQLSAEALNLWERLEAAEDESALLEVLQGIEKKVDAIAWVDEQYTLNIEVAQLRLQRLTELHAAAINRMLSKQQALRNYLLHLHQRGLIQDKLVGSERAIAIRQNPPKCELKVEAEHLPEKFVEVETTITVKPQKKAIIEAWKRGEDVSNFADIAIGYRVQFGFQTEPNRQKT